MACRICCIDVILLFYGLSGVFSEYIHLVRIATDGLDSPSCLNLSNNDNKVSSAPCRTLDFVFTHVQKTKSLQNSTEIIMQTGVYALNSTYRFEKLMNFLVTGQMAGFHKSNGEVIIQCNKGVGLAFVRCRNLILSELKFTNCGSWQNSTSINHPIFLAAIFVVYSENLIISGCQILESPGVGVNLYDVGGNVFVERSTFAENYALNSWNFTYKNGKIRVGGGLHIEMTYCGALFPFDCDNLERNKFNSGSSYVITNCKFMDNNASVGNHFHQTFNTNPSGTNFNSVGRGGGISFFVKGSATDNTFSIDNCTFVGNAADWGAGYAVYFQDNSSSNYLRVTNSAFRENVARYGGGAIKCLTTMFGTFEDLIEREPNHYSHENCVFEQNKATEGWGGAFSAFGSTSFLGVGWKSRFIPSFVNCYWRENSATAGAAIGVLTKPSELWRKKGHEVRGFGFSIKLVNNTFLKNNIIPTQYHVTVYGMGTIYTVFVPVLMLGSVKFIENSHTALLLDSAPAEVYGNVHFHKNNGIFGGAVGIYGTSAFILQAGASLKFQENSALNTAGAIYVKTAGPNIAAFYETIFQRHRCFFRYFNDLVHPNKWNASVVFQGNKASTNIGRTLFANTLQFCRYGHAGLINDAVKNWTSFKFLNESGLPSNDDLEIATEAVQMSIHSDEWNDISPNEKFSPAVRLLDERNNSVYGLLKVTIEEQNSDKPVRMKDGVSSYFFVKDQIHSLWLTGKPFSKFNVNISSITSQSIKMTIWNRTVKRCPPGFFETKNTCKCLTVRKRNIGISRCGQDGKSLYLSKGYWGGPGNSNGQKGSKCLFSVMQCPYGYCRCSSNSSDGLTNPCECLYDHTESQCVSGREGILCGKCKKHLSAVIGSYKCQRCDKKDVWMLIPFFLILTFLVFLFICLKVDFFSGYFNCWLYTYQIIHIILPDDFTAKDPFMNFVVKITNARFPFGTWCLWNGMNDLQRTSLGYVASVFQIFVLFVFYKLSSRFAILQGNFLRPFSTIVVLSYSGIVNLVFKQLHPVYICSEWRVYISGEVKFFTDEHIIHASVAIIVLLFVVLPFPVMLVCSSFFVRRCRLIAFLSIPLLDVLKSCYCSERSWFAAYYIVCRLIAVLLHTFTPDINARHKMLQIFCVLVLFVFLYLKPYTTDTLMKIDTFFLSFLILISLLAEVVVTCSFFVSPFYYICFYCIHILLYIPFIYSLVLLYYHIRHLTRKAKQNSRNVSVNQVTTSSQDNSKGEYERL